MELSVENKIRLAAEQRKLCEAVQGTDFCVSGGRFACLCNKCTEFRSWLMTELPKEIDAVFLEAPTTK